MTALKAIEERPVTPTTETGLMDHELRPSIEIAGPSEEIILRAQWLLFAIDQVGRTTQIKIQSDQAGGGESAMEVPDNKTVTVEEINTFDDPLALSLNPVRLLVRQRKQLRSMTALERASSEFAAGDTSLNDVIQSINEVHRLDGNAVGVRVDETRQGQEHLIDTLVSLAALCAQTVLGRGHATFLGDSEYDPENSKATFDAEDLADTLAVYKRLLEFSRDLPDGVVFARPLLVETNYGRPVRASELIKESVKQIISPPRLGYGIEAFFAEKTPLKEGAKGHERAMKFKDNYAVDAIESLGRLGELADLLGVNRTQFIGNNALLVAGELSVVHGNYDKALDYLLDAVADDEQAKSELLLEAHRALLSEKRSMGIDRNRRLGKIAGFKAMREMESVGAGRLIERQLHIAVRFREFGDEKMYAVLAESIASDILDELEILGADIYAPRLSPEEVLVLEEFSHVLSTELRISLISNALHKLEDSKDSFSEHSKAFNTIRVLHAERVIVFDESGQLSQETVEELRQAEELINGVEDDHVKQLMAFLFADLLVYIAQTGADVEQFCSDPLIIKNVSEITEVVAKIAADQKELLNSVKEGEEDTIQAARSYVEEKDGIASSDIDAEIERVTDSMGVSINLSTEALRAMLFDAQGNTYVSSWDVGYRGSLYALLRDAVENQMSIRLRSRLLAAPQVVYGAVTSSNGKDEVLGAAPGGYGNSWVTLRTEEVRDRTVVTPQDSFFGPTRQLRGTLDGAGPVFTAINNIKNGSYAEAQIVGGVTAADVAEIHIPEEEATPQLIENIKKVYPDIKVSLIDRRQASQVIKRRKRSVLS